MLLVGPPGTGKTLLARAVAGEAHVPFFSLSGSEFVEMFVGVGAARIRDLFQQAEAKAPCIVFIDELDALGKARVQSPIGSHEEREQTLNQLLAEMDGFDSRKGVIIMGATNRPEVLDPALLRPGRFDRQVLVDKPDVKGREEILRIHAKGVKLSPDVDLRIVAARTAGFAGADLANLVNEAALLAARDDKTEVGPKDFESAIDRLIAGLEKKRVMSTKEREIVAYHESGPRDRRDRAAGLDPVHKISIVQRGFGALGYTMQLPLEDRYLMTRGRSAQPAGGAARRPHRRGNRARRDLDRRAERPAARHRHRARDGHRVRHERRRSAPSTTTATSARASSTSRMPQERGLYGEETAQKIDAEIKRILTDAHDTARQILTEHRDKLETIASASARGRGDGRRRAPADPRTARASQAGREDAGRKPRAQELAFTFPGCHGRFASTPCPGTDSASSSSRRAAAPSCATAWSNRSSPAISICSSSWSSAEATPSTAATSSTRSGPTSLFPTAPSARLSAPSAVCSMTIRASRDSFAPSRDMATSSSSLRSSRKTTAPAPWQASTSQPPAAVVAPVAPDLTASGIDPFTPLLERIARPAGTLTEQEDQRDAAERLHALGTADALMRLSGSGHHGFARALLRDTRWDTPQAGRVPILGEPDAPAAAWHLVRLRLRRALGLVAARWASAAGGGAVAGAAGGCIGGILLVAASGNSSPAAVVPVCSIGTVCGGIAGAGIGAGLAVSEAVLRSWRTAGTIAGGALGGGLVGLGIQLLAGWTLQVLEDVHPPVGGVWQGLVIGGTAALGYALATRRWLGGIPAPRGRARWRVALFTAVACGLGALAVSLAAGRS